MYHGLVEISTLAVIVDVCPGPHLPQGEPKVLRETVDVEAKEMGKEVQSNEMRASIAGKEVLVSICTPPPAP